jgi:hypothetical protein
MGKARGVLEVIRELHSIQPGGHLKLLEGHDVELVLVNLVPEIERVQRPI